jgi:hypothetical protein
LLRCMRAFRRAHRLGLQQVWQQEPQPQSLKPPQPLVQPLAQPLLQVSQVLQELQVLQQVLRRQRAISRCRQLGLQQVSQQAPQPQSPPHPPQPQSPPHPPSTTAPPHPPPPQDPAAGALAKGAPAAGAPTKGSPTVAGVVTAGAAGAAGAASAPANHAVVTSKNAAFTSVILRWSLTLAEGHRASAGRGPLRENWRPAPSTSFPHQRAASLQECEPR